MTNTEIAIATLTAAQDAFDAIADEHQSARAALKRSKSNVNKARYAASVEAFDKALDEITALHEAVNVAEALDAKIAADAEKAELVQVGFYVTMKRGERVAWLAGPYASKGEAESHVRDASDKAIEIDPFAHWDVFGVTRLERKSDVPLPLGVLTKNNLI